MIKVIARSTIKEGTLNKVLDIYQELVEETRREKGCISYELYQELNNENELTLIEEWLSLNDLEDHTNTSQFQRLVKKLSQYEIELPVLIYKRLI